jgi:hypothetical protein
MGRNRAAYVQPNHQPVLRALAEDNCPIEQVNTRGHRWVSMKPFFDRRSESNVKNRWYSHLKLECVQDAFSGKWPRRSWKGEKKVVRRARRKRCPSQSESFDFWDNSLCEHAFEEDCGNDSELESTSEP